MRHAWQVLIGPVGFDQQAIGGHTKRSLAHAARPDSEDVQPKREAEPERQVARDQLGRPAVRVNHAAEWSVAREPLERVTVPADHVQDHRAIEPTRELQLRVTHPVLLRKRATDVPVPTELPDGRAGMGLEPVGQRRETGELCGRMHAARGQHPKARRAGNLHPSVDPGHEHRAHPRANRARTRPRRERREVQMAMTVEVDQASAARLPALDSVSTGSGTGSMVPSSW